MTKTALLFCEQKRSKKNFINLEPSWRNGQSPDLIKVFWFFFSKKNGFLAVPGALA
jgi:hypothetical protein